MRTRPVVERMLGHRDEMGVVERQPIRSPRSGRSESVRRAWKRRASRRLRQTAPRVMARRAMCKLGAVTRRAMSSARPSRVWRLEARCRLFPLARPQRRPRLRVVLRLQATRRCCSLGSRRLVGRANQQSLCSSRLRRPGPRVAMRQRVRSSCAGLRRLCAPRAGMSRLSSIRDRLARCGVRLGGVRA